MKKVILTILVFCSLLIGCNNSDKRADTEFHPLHLDGGKYGYIDTLGNWAIEPQFTDADQFYDGLAMVEKDFSIGYINKRGKYIVKPKYSDGTHFADGRAFVQVDKGSTIVCIDKKGRVRFSLDKAIYVQAFSEKRTVIKNEDGSVAIIDIDGNIINSCQFEDCLFFSEGLLPAKHNGKWGYIDLNGKIAIPFVFDNTSIFHNHLAAAREEGRWGVIDMSGKWVLSPRYENIGLFNDNRCVIRRDSLWGYIDSSFKVVIKPQFEQADPFNEGVAWVCQGGRWGVINEKGDFVIEPQYDGTCSNFFNGVALVSKIGNDKVGIIDKRGKVIADFTYFYSTRLPFQSQELYKYYD